MGKMTIPRTSAWKAAGLPNGAGEVQYGDILVEHGIQGTSTVTQTTTATLYETALAFTPNPPPFQLLPPLPPPLPYWKL